ncbi:MAG: ribonuclease HI [Phycisphaerae bacterium]
MSDQPDVILYTDGACSGNPGPGGWGLILKHVATGAVKKLRGGDPNTTNNRMELTAVIEGLKALKGDKGRRVHLVSDSEYVIKGLTQWIQAWIAHDWRRGKKETSPPVKNADLWQTLHALTERHDMTYEHVRGHSGHPENEECDRMAVAAIERQNTRDRLSTWDRLSSRSTDRLESLSHTEEAAEKVQPQVRRAFSGAKWEKQVGYCRAIRVENHIYVTGTAPVDENSHVYAPGDAYAQTRRCLEIIEKALHELDATVAHVVRTRLFVTDITRWAEFGRAHREFFAGHLPATTMVEVRSLLDPQMLIEIEADAVVPPSQ